MSKNKTVIFPEEQFNTLCNLFELMVVCGLKLHGSGSGIPSDQELRTIWCTLRDTVLDHAYGTEADKETELEFLRFFYERVSPCLGPADGDIYDSIKKEFMNKTGKILPQNYLE